MSIETKSFGKTKNNESITMYTLTNRKGTKASFINYGAILVSLLVADKNGKLDDVVLGYDNLESYENGNNPGFGSFIGRHANRIGDAKFSIGEREYTLQKNDGENNLHGGAPGYNKVVYKAETSSQAASDSITFSRLSKDMEQGFPGNLDVKMTYTLTDDDELVLDYSAVCDQDTLVNLTNHSYFNLAGHNAGDILGHMVTIKANQFTPTNDALIPEGEFTNVEGTPMDFRKSKRIGDEIESKYQPLVIAGGYDHNYVLDKPEDEFAYVGELYEVKSGRKMEIYTDLPGMQFYTGNFISTEEGKDNATYTRRHGVCFETQYFPNSCNVKEFKSCLLPKGKEYKTKTIYKFV